MRLTGAKLAAGSDAPHTARQQRLPRCTRRTFNERGAPGKSKRKRARLKPTPVKFQNQPVMPTDSGPLPGFGPLGHAVAAIGFSMLLSPQSKRKFNRSMLFVPS